jgi:hypothetical protein
VLPAGIEGGDTTILDRYAVCLAKLSPPDTRRTSSAGGRSAIVWRSSPDAGCLLCKLFDKAAALAIEERNHLRFGAIVDFEVGVLTSLRSPAAAERNLGFAVSRVGAPWRELSSPVF